MNSAIVRVLDKNMFHDEETGHWLAEGRNHLVVITDFAMMESYSGDPSRNFIESFVLLKNFPEQVVKMKNNDRLRMLDGCNSTTSDLVDWDETIDLRLSLGVLKERGPEELREKESIRKNGILAAKKLREIQARLSPVKSTMDQVAPDIRKYAVSEEGRRILGEKGVGVAKSLAMQIFCQLSGMPQQTAQGITKTQMQSFTFRYAAACTASLITRLLRGSMAKLSDEKARNDVIDCNYMACATYCNGLMTRDEVVASAYDFLQGSLLK